MDQIEIRLWRVHAVLGAYETVNGVSAPTFIEQILISFLMLWECGTLMTMTTADQIKAPMIAVPLSQSSV